MNKEPLLSIIIANYNQDSEIFDMLEQFQRWDLKNVEIIVTVDGSETGFLFQDFLNYKTLPPIKLVWQQDRGNRLWEAFNNGAKIAKGKYLQFMDGDTYLKENYLKKLIPKLDPGKILSIRRDSMDAETHKVKKIDDRKEQFKKGKLPEYCYATGGTLVIPRESFTDLDGYFYEEFGYGLADFELVMRLMICRYSQLKFEFVNNAIIYHLDHTSKEAPSKKDVEEFKRIEAGIMGKNILFKE